MFCHLPGPAYSETCRYEGKTSYGGRLSIIADAVARGNAVRVDVRLSLDAQPAPLFHTRYRMEEISDADANGIARLAVNNRYSVDGRLVRQGWDVFDRADAGLQAHRIEGKRAGEFARQHPRFARHWDPATFGQSWVDDFERASPERRADLDLAAMSAFVRPPLALAFYWLGWLPDRAASVPVFLPGFKDQKRVDIAVGKTFSAAGALTRAAPLRYPELSARVPSTATAWLSPGRQVLQLAFDLHGLQYSARATISALGCTGVLPLPPGSGVFARP